MARARATRVIAFHVAVAAVINDFFFPVRLSVHWRSPNGVERCVRSSEWERERGWGREGAHICCCTLCVCALFIILLSLPLLLLLLLLLVCVSLTLSFILSHITLLCCNSTAAHTHTHLPTYTHSLMRHDRFISWESKGLGIAVRYLNGIV